MIARKAVSTWILYDNLQLFLRRISAIIGYRFEDWDWDAIRFGVCDAASGQNPWYTYELIGVPPVLLAFAEAGDGKRLQMRVETEVHMAVRVDALARIMQCYRETTTQELEVLIQAAFIGTSKPDRRNIVACDANRLELDTEYQFALSFFQDKAWRDLLRSKEPLPRSFGGLDCLTEAARRFFFPVYLAVAMRDQDRDLLENALRSVGPKSWSPLQHELIEFAAYLLQTGRS